MSTRNVSSLAALVSVAMTTAAACSGPDDGKAARRSVGAPSDPAAGTGEEDAGAAALCSADVGKKYAGFGGAELTAGREGALPTADRVRVKPYGALAGELTRTIGVVPAKLASAGPTFDEPPARWFIEPKANAGSMYTAFTLAFDGCLTFTKDDAKYASAPTASSAAAECTAMARKFWSRAPDADESAACVDAAMVGFADEVDARRRWALTCAAVLSATGFLTY